MMIRIDDWLIIEYFHSCQNLAESSLQLMPWMSLLIGSNMMSSSLLVDLMSEPAKSTASVRTAELDGREFNKQSRHGATLSLRLHGFH